MRRTRQTALVIDGKKLCTACKETKAVAEFYSMKRNKSGLHSWCKQCSRDAERRRPRVVTDGVKAIELKSGLRKFNLTVEQYRYMLESQGGVCAICRTPPTTVRLAVDHDHACCPGNYSCGQCVRGLLCNGCNQGLGRLELYLKEAMSYVSKEQPQE